MGEFAGPRSLRQLLDAVLTVGSDLDLSAMSQRIVEAAVDLVDARYGALGVLDDSRTRLAEFLTVGIDEETHKAIGHVPEGHGILGLLIVDAKPLRLPDLREHPDSYGFPPHHPPMPSSGSNRASNGTAMGCAPESSTWWASRDRCSDSSRPCCSRARSIRRR
ncbi:MAG TPA: GAF domain-containing protein, partial [Acidimicrobiales bacterium]|nr:GAF domain-containing protein [Acidimicrobiales bacterium]